MPKNKKITLTVSVILAVLIIFGAAAGIWYYLANRITFPINDTLQDGGGKKARVILLGGQSNASGYSSDEYLQKNVSSEKYSEYEKGYDNVYINYYSFSYNIPNDRPNASCGFVKCSTRQGQTGGYFGPELGLAEKLHEAYPDELFFIIKCAWGNTSLFEQWISPSSDGKTGRMYKEFRAFVKTSLEYLHDKNYDVQIEGMCWMQGESDCFEIDKSENYGVHLTNFIKDIRNDFSKYAANDGIAFVDAYIADNPMYWVYCDTVNAKKLEVANSSPLNSLVDTIAHGLTCYGEPEDKPDVAHYDSLSQIKLGHLFADEIIKFL